MRIWHGKRPDVAYDWQPVIVEGYLTRHQEEPLEDGVYELRRLWAAAILNRVRGLEAYWEKGGWRPCRERTSLNVATVPARHDVWDFLIFLFQPETEEMCEELGILNGLKRFQARALRWFWSVMILFERLCPERDKYIFEHGSAKGWAKFQKESSIQT